MKAMATMREGGAWIPIVFTLTDAGVEVRWLLEEGRKTMRATLIHSVQIIGINREWDRVKGWRSSH